MAQAMASQLSAMRAVHQGASADEVADLAIRGNWVCEEETPIWPTEAVATASAEDDAEYEAELARLKTLEERIMHKYTPSRLDMTSTQADVPVRERASVVVAEEGQGYSAVKPCAECSGVGKAYKYVVISDGAVNGPCPGGEGLTRVIESACPVCRGMAIVGDATMAQADASEADPVAAARARALAPISRVEIPSGVEEELAGEDDAVLEARFGPSPFVRR